MIHRPRLSVFVRDTSTAQKSDTLFTNVQLVYNDARLLRRVNNAFDVATVDVMYRFDITY